MTEEKIKNNILELIEKIFKRHEADLTGDAMFSNVMKNAVEYLKISLIKELDKNPKKVLQWCKDFREGIKQDLKDFDKVLK